jgi:hypothetical protein
MTPEEAIYNGIRAIYGDMTEEELEVEFLIRMWIAAVRGKVQIRRDNQKSFTVYIFHGIKVTHTGDVPGVPISPQHYYNELLSDILVQAIKKGYVFVVDTTGQKDYAFKNSHDVDWDDLIIHAMPKEDAIQFTLDLVEKE